MYIKPSRERDIPQRKRSIYSSIPMFQGKSDVQASKNGEVSFKERKYPMFLSSKWNNFMKRWRTTSNMDGLLKMFSRND
jgi:hypothetical protein